MVHFLLYIRKNILFLRQKGFSMYKIIINILIFNTLLFSAYNPFFTEVKPVEKAQKQEPQQIIKTTTKKETKYQIPKKTDIQLQYFGFVETQKGKFALINFSGKTIVVKQKDSLYLGEKTYKIQKISSNYLLVEDSYKRVQSVYFSSESRDKN